MKLVRAGLPCALLAALGVVLGMEGCTGTPPTVRCTIHTGAPAERAASFYKNKQYGIRCPDGYKCDATCGSRGNCDGCLLEKVPGRCASASLQLSYSNDPLVVVTNEAVAAGANCESTDDCAVHCHDRTGFPYNMRGIEFACLPVSVPSWGKGRCGIYVASEAECAEWVRRGDESFAGESGGASEWRLWSGMTGYHYAAVTYSEKGPAAAVTESTSRVGLCAPCIPTGGDCLASKVDAGVGYDPRFCCSGVCYAGGKCG